MKISADNKLIRFAYWGCLYTPDSTTLCKLFWLMVFKVLLCLVPVALLVAYICAWVLHPRDTLEITLFIAVIPTIFGILEYLQHLSKKRQSKQKLEPSVARKLASEAFFAVKHRICPIIHIER